MTTNDQRNPKSEPAAPRGRYLRSQFRFRHAAFNISARLPPVSFRFLEVKLVEEAVEHRGEGYADAGDKRQAAE